MSIITRKFSACPVRTAAQTWATITRVIADKNQHVEKELTRICGVASSIIADGSPKGSPITIIGSGSRLRIYCIYDEDGSVEDATESPLTWDLFERDDWEIWLPTESENLSWIDASLKKEGSRFKVYEAGTKIAADKEEETLNNNSSVLSIDIEKLKSNG